MRAETQDRCIVLEQQQQQNLIPQHERYMGIISSKMALRRIYVFKINKQQLNDIYL